MLDVITANEIVNALQCKGHNIEWVKDHYLNTFITMDSLVNVTIGNVDYWVMPIISFTNTNATILGFINLCELFMKSANIAAQLQNSSHKFIMPIFLIIIMMEFI